MDSYEDKMLEKSKLEIIEEKKHNLRRFVDKHEYDKKNITEIDQFHMLMQLVESGHITELNKLNDNDKKDKEYIDIINCKWKFIKKYIKTLWETTNKDNKYQFVMAKITSINLWDSGFNTKILGNLLAEKTKKNTKIKNTHNENSNDNDNNKDKDTEDIIDENDIEDIDEININIGINFGDDDDDEDADNLP